MTKSVSNKTEIMCLKKAIQYETQTDSSAHMGTVDSAEMGTVEGLKNSRQCRNGHRPGVFLAKSTVPKWAPLLEYAIHYIFFTRRHGGASVAVGLVGGVS